jgi:hypothetical protein
MQSSTDFYDAYTGTLRDTSGTRFRTIHQRLDSNDLRALQWVLRYPRPIADRPVSLVKDYVRDSYWYEYGTFYLPPTSGLSLSAYSRLNRRLRANSLNALSLTFPQL